jgi:hypothetical protein
VIEEHVLKKYAQEINQMQRLPPVSVEIPPVAALAIISHIQLALRHPGTEDPAEFTQIAIDVAKQLQSLFNPESTTYQVLELGWNPWLEPRRRSADGRAERERSSTVRSN